MKYSVVMSLFHRDPDQTEYAKDAVSLVKTHSSDYEFIVIDNGSTEDTSWVECDTKITFKENRGISQAWNAGIKMARGEYIVQVNDDVLVQRGWLQSLLDCLDEPRAMAGCLISQTQSGIGIDENYHWFNGSCFILPRSTIDTVGLFDERFFPCSFEDTDYWTRILREGGKLYQNCKSRIVHKEGMTVHAPDQAEGFEENKQRYVDKHGFDPIPVFYGDQEYDYNL